MKIVRLHIQTKYSEREASNIISYLEKVPQQLTDVRSLLSEEEVSIPIRPGERSLRDMLAHLIHCEARSHEAIVSALAVDVPRIVKIHPEKQYGKLLNFEQLAPDSLLDYFKLRRMVLAGLLRRLTANQWVRTIEEEGKTRRESVYLLARSLVLHEAEHVYGFEEEVRQQQVLPPQLLMDLIEENRWVHPGDEVLKQVIPFLADPVDFLPTSRLKWSVGWVDQPNMSEMFKEVRGTKDARGESLPWLDGERAIMLAENRNIGDDVAIYLDYRIDPQDPRVVASYWTEDGVDWREVAPTFSRFVEMLGV